MNSWIAGVLCAVFASTCTPQPMSMVETPSQVTIFDLEKNPAAVAIPLTEKFLIAAESGPEEFFWNEKPLDIAARFLAQKIIFFHAPDVLKKNAEFSTQPPAVGSDIFWFSHGEPVRGEILRVEDERLVASGVTTATESGTPLFDPDGKIYGVVIGSSPVAGEIFAVRSDVILNFFTENVQ